MKSEHDCLIIIDSSYHSAGYEKDGEVADAVLLVTDPEKCKATGPDLQVESVTVSHSIISASVDDK